MNIVFSTHLFSLELLVSLCSLFLAAVAYTMLNALETRLITFQLVFHCTKLKWRIHCQHTLQKKMLYVFFFSLSTYNSLCMHTYRYDDVIRSGFNCCTSLFCSNAAIDTLVLLLFDSTRNTEPDTYGRCVYATTQSLRSLSKQNRNNQKLLSSMIFSRSFGSG